LEEEKHDMSYKPSASRKKKGDPGNNRLVAAKRGENSGRAEWLREELLRHQRRGKRRNQMNDGLGNLAPKWHEKTRASEKRIVAKKGGGAFGEKLPCGKKTATHITGVLEIIPKTIRWAVRIKGSKVLKWKRTVHITCEGSGSVGGLSVDGKER